MKTLFYVIWSTVLLAVIATVGAEMMFGQDMGSLPLWLTLVLFVLSFIGLKIDSHERNARDRALRNVDHAARERERAYHEKGPNMKAAVHLAMGLAIVSALAGSISYVAGRDTAVLALGSAVAFLALWVISEIIESREIASRDPNNQS